LSNRVPPVELLSLDQAEAAPFRTACASHDRLLVVHRNRFLHRGFE
jgi:hypothetical protein